jgi:hypothetical protein
MTTSTESIKKCAHSLLACGSALVADEALWGDFLNCLSAMHAALALPPDPPSPDPPCPDCHEMTKQRDHYMQRADALVTANDRLREKAEVVEREHCRDCCCAQSWRALGISEFNGKSIPEHIELLRAENAKLREALDVWKAAAIEWKRAAKTLKEQL